MAIVHGLHGARDELRPVGELRIVVAIASHSVSLRESAGGKSGQESDGKESTSHGFPRNAVSIWRSSVGCSRDCPRFLKPPLILVTGVAAENMLASSSSCWQAVTLCG